MAEIPIFFTHKPPYIRTFNEVYPTIPKLLELFRKQRYVERRDRAFIAWKNWQSDGAGDRLARLGVAGFYERFMRNLEDAQAGIEWVVADHSGHPKEIEPIDEIGSCNDPWHLMDMYEDASLFAQFEIERKLTIATQIMCIAAADPYEDVTAQLTQINIRAGKELFETGQGAALFVHFALDSGRHSRVHSDFPVRVAHARLEIPAFDQPVRVIKYVCRAVVDSSIKYYIYTNSRPKDRLSGVIKLERGGSLTDRRGLKHVIVGVEENGILRPPDWSDVLRFVIIAKRRLWRPPLHERTDSGPPNPKSHPDYRVEKIVGEVHDLRHDDERRPYIVAAPVEHQIMALVDHLNAEHATDELGHKGYRHRVIRDCILERWFAYEWYGIDWKAENGNMQKS